MNNIEYENMANFERSYWWHKGRLFLIRLWLEKILAEFSGTGKPQIFEVGCGTGATNVVLNEYGNTTSMDVSSEAVKYCKQRGIKNVFVADIVTMNISKYKGKFDVALALDVLEHIQDDVEAMVQVYKLLKPGGYFLITVPAYKFLWSHHDEALHHKRRYHSLEITQKLRDVGFKITKRSHFVFTLFFPVLFIKVFVGNFFGRTAYPKTSSYVKLPDSLNNLLTYILKVEAWVLNYVYLPLGTTIFIVSHKPKN